MPRRGSGKRTPPGVPGTQLCRNDHPATRCVSHNYATGHSTGRAFRYGSSGSEGGRRSREQRGHRPSRYLRTTTLLVRRWDAGTPSASQKAGVEGMPWPWTLEKPTRCAKHIKCSACRPAPFETIPAGQTPTRGPVVRGASDGFAPFAPLRSIRRAGDQGATALHAASLPHSKPSPKT